MLLSYFVRSRILEEMIVAFGKKQISIPQNVLENMKSARVLMKILDASQKSKEETEPRIDEYLGMAEAYLITEAEKHFSQEAVDDWLNKLRISSCDTCVTVEKEKKESRFISGVPRDQKGIRVKPLNNIPVSELESMATKAHLSFRQEKDGHLVVYGDERNVKEFIKKMTIRTNKEQN